MFETALCSLILLAWRRLSLEHRFGIDRAPVLRSTNAIDFYFCFDFCHFKKKNEDHAAFGIERYAMNEGKVDGVERNVCRQASHDNGATAFSWNRCDQADVGKVALLLT